MLYSNTAFVCNSCVIYIIRYIIHELVLIEKEHEKLKGIQVTPKMGLMFWKVYVFLVTFMALFVPCHLEWVTLYYWSKRDHHFSDS